MIEALLGPLLGIKFLSHQIDQGMDRGGGLRKSPELRQVWSSDKPLTVEQATAVALRLSPSLAQAASALRFALGRNQVVRSDYLPKLSVTPGLQDISRITTEAYTIQATLPLDISRLMEVANEQGKYEEIGARLEVNRARNDVTFKTESAFYEELRAQALVRVAKDNLTNSQARLDDAQARYQARVVAYIDVVRAETDLAEAKRRLIDAQSVATEGLAGLSQAMGVDVTSRYAISDSEPAAPAATIDSELDHAEFHRAIDEASENRPEILASKARLAAAHKGIQLAKSSILPSLMVGLGYYDLRTQSGSRVNEPQAFVGLNIPIYDAGLSKGRVEEAKAVVDDAESIQREATDQVSRQVQSAFLALSRAEDELLVAQQALKEAQMAYDLAKVRYQTGVSSRAGISPLIELSDAQTALTLADQNLVNARYDVAEAHLAIDYSTGRFAFLNSGSQGGLRQPPSSHDLGSNP